MTDRLRDQDGRWATLLVAASDAGGDERAQRELLFRRLEPAARRLARAAGLSQRFYYFTFGPGGGVQLVLVLAGTPREARERLVRALGRCAARWERRGWAAKSVHGFMDIERGLPGFGGPAGLQAVEALETLASQLIVDALARAGSILRMARRTAFALSLADAVLGAVFRDSDEKFRASGVWRSSYGALLERDGFQLPARAARGPTTTSEALLESLEPWQRELLGAFQSGLRAPGAALRDGVLSTDKKFPVLSDVAWRRVIHQTWGRLGLSAVEEVVLVDWLSAIYERHD